MITIVDYHKGNLMSVERGLAAQGAAVRVTDDAAVIARASAVVLPGVGAFGDAAATMVRLGQMEAVREAVGRGAAFLGICLGMHLMFEAGEEGAPDGGPNPQGLGLIPGVVRRLPRQGADGASFKVPHVGWNSVVPPVPPEPDLRDFSLMPSPLLDGIAPGEYFYFTHSYVAPDGPATIGLTTHSVTFPSTVAVSGRAFGVQFHPEKSSDAGAQLLRNFVTLAEEA